MNPLERLSQFAAELDYPALPAEVQDQTGWILADTIAAIVGGSAEPEMRALSKKLGGSGDSSVLGLGQSASADVAALLNGTAGTFLEMDEGNRFSRGHPAIHVIPAALALAEQRAIDARDFLSAVVVGYEVGSRIGAASRLRASMHPHGTWGTIGAAAACARLAGMDAQAMAETINIGASLTTATSKRTMLEGGLVRNVYAGMSNRQGLLALQLAESGFTGERDAVASLMGSIVSEHFEPQEMLRDGRTLQGEVGVNRGDDALPYSRDELRGKFMELTGRVWPQDHAAQVLQATLAMANNASGFSDWTALLRHPSQLA